MLVPINQATLPHVKEEGNLNQHGYDNLKSACILLSTHIYVFLVFLTISSNCLPEQHSFLICTESCLWNKIQWLNVTLLAFIIQRPCHRSGCSGLSPQRSGINPRPVYLWIMVDAAALDRFLYQYFGIAMRPAYTHLNNLFRKISGRRCGNFKRNNAVSDIGGRGTQKCFHIGLCAPESQLFIL
jgi:hypothetical protein